MGLREGSESFYKEVSGLGACGDFNPEACEDFGRADGVFHNPQTESIPTKPISNI